MKTSFERQWRTGEDGKLRHVPVIKLSEIPHCYYYPIMSWLDEAGFCKSGELPEYGEGTIRIRVNVSD